MADEPIRKYGHHEVHQALAAADGVLSERYQTTDYITGQALMCPYYVPLEGVLGSDWGVIVNPESNRFGKLTFEHDECGCPQDDPMPSGEVYPRHRSGSQRVDEWRDRRRR